MLNGNIVNYSKKNKKLNLTFNNDIWQEDFSAGRLQSVVEDLNKVPPKQTNLIDCFHFDLFCIL